MKIKFIIFLLALFSMKSSILESIMDLSIKARILNQFSKSLEPNSLNAFTSLKLLNDMKTHRNLMYELDTIILVYTLTHHHVS